jgi:hypothetical protein
VGQLAAEIRRLGIPAPAAREPRPQPHAAPSGCTLPRADVDAALARVCSIPVPALDLPSTLWSDLQNNLVTRYDVAAYLALLKVSTNGSLRNRALDFEFGSHRGAFLGRVLSLLKRMSLRLQDGLVRTIEISHNDLEHELAALNDKIDLLAAEVARRHGAPVGGGGAEPRRAPESEGQDAGETEPRRRSGS